MFGSKNLCDVVDLQRCAQSIDFITEVVVNLKKKQII